MPAKIHMVNDLRRKASTATARTIIQRNPSNAHREAEFIATLAHEIARPLQGIGAHQFVLVFNSRLETTRDLSEICIKGDAAHAVLPGYQRMNVIIPSQPNLEANQLFSNGSKDKRG
jgi:nitrogen-specific signal transduction histidine kinase